MAKVGGSDNVPNNIKNNIEQIYEEQITKSSPEEKKILNKNGLVYLGKLMQK